MVLHREPSITAVAGAMSEAGVQQLQDENPVAKGGHVRAAEPTSGVKFGKNNEFQAGIRRRVDQFFQTMGRRRRDVPQMYVKTGVLLVGFAALYVAMVFLARTWWQGVPLAILLGLTTAGTGFNIQHDGGHQAYSEHPWVNKLMALTLDLIGGSSYLWHYKHGVYHHTYVNITHEDTDIDLGMLARLTPHQQRYWFHRWQHFYIWSLYAVSLQVLMITPSAGTKVYEQTFTSGMGIDRAGGRRVLPHMYDGNYVVASSHKRPWRKQLNMLAGHLTSTTRCGWPSFCFAGRQRCRTRRRACRSSGCWGWSKRSAAPPGGRWG